jgi:hypothetical protein
MRPSRLYAESVMHRVPGPESNPAPRIERDREERPRYAYPETLTPEERAEMDRVLDVDGEAYLRWLAGEGPDPCDESRR